MGGSRRPRRPRSVHRAHGAGSVAGDREPTVVHRRLGVDGDYPDRWLVVSIVERIGFVNYGPDQRHPVAPNAAAERVDITWRRDLGRIMTGAPTFGETLVRPQASVEFEALGTTARLCVTDGWVLPEAEALLREELQSIDRAASRFRSDSELAGVNAAAGKPVSVSPLFLDAVQVARRAARLTNGAVDLTVGRALRIIGYDRDFAEVAESGEALRIRMAPIPGWELVDVDAARSTVRVPAGVELDLGATAKAFAADRAAAAVNRCTGAGALVSLGGDIAVAGPVPDGGWSVFVTDDHRAPAGAPGQGVSIVSGGLATSSTTVRHWRRGSEVLHHLIDPATGLSATSCWRTVSVAAASCVDANIASTAAILRGLSAPDWLGSLGLPARLLDQEGRATLTGGWPKEQP